MSVMEKTHKKADFKTSVQRAVYIKRAKQEYSFRTQYVCDSLKELLEGFGYELTKIQVRLNNRTESKI